MNSQKKTKSKSNTQGGQAKKAKKQKQSINLESRNQSVPIAQSRGNKVGLAKIVHGKNSMRVQHREFIKNVFGQSDFTVESLDIQPGVAQTFPWLSNLANNFDEYVIHGLEFEFLTRTGTTTPGSVILAPDYDSSDATPISEQVISTFANAVEDAPWKNIRCQLSPSSMRGGMSRKFIRSLPLLANQDIKTYDCGKFYSATVDGTSSAGWGKLWVKYDIEFFVPSLHSTGTTLTTVITTPGGVGVTLAGPLGTAPAIKLGSQGFVTSSDRTIVAQSPGDYLIQSYGIGTGLTGAATPTITNGPGNISSFVNGVNAAGTAILQTFSAKNLDLNSVITLGALSGTTLTASSLEAVRAIAGILQ